MSVSIVVRNASGRSRAERSAPPGSADVIPLRDGDEARLVARIAEGDGAALAELYDRHGRPAYGLALRVTANPTLAEDAVQEAFCAVWRQAGSYQRSRGTVASWLFSLVHHKAVDVVRRERARQRPLNAADVETVEEHTPEHHALARAEGAHVRAALARLGDGQRQLLEWLYLDGLTQREVAERLDVPLGTVKSRTHAAMGALRRALAAA
jgi:RNA polymerase sigma-70 factor (ECF subfamily)